MRIGLTSPFGHPDVWRGAERYCRELATWLGERGHDTTWLVTTTDDTRDATLEPEGVRMRYQHRSRDRGWGVDRYDVFLRCIGPLARGVRQCDFEVIEAHHYVDAAAVRLARRRGTPYVMWIPGLPRKASLAGLPLHKVAFRFAVGGAARLHCLSEFARSGFQREMGLQADVMRPGVDTRRYLGPRAGGEPIVLCTAAPGDPRKRVDLLVSAFPEVLRRVPDARLVLAAHDADAAARMLDSLPGAARERATVAHDPNLEELAELYRGAAVSVLPSVDEAFGLVLVESLAAGTPVVASDRGAAREIISTDGVGRLFANDDPTSLVDAIVDTMKLSSESATAERCRDHSMHWDWSKVGPELEEIYAALL
ncbi:MAG: glycosyltransferase family 4 protein [Microthrixaceae bacterium]